MADIDNLQIKISANASKANEDIDKLITRLDRLSVAIGRVDGSKFAGLANGVQRLGTAMQTMNSVKTADFTRLAANIDKLGNLNTTALNEAASATSRLSKALNSMSAVSANAQAVGTLASSLSKLGTQSIQKAATTIPQLAVSLNGLMVTLSKSPKVSNNVLQLVQSLSGLANQGARVQSTGNSMASGINNASSSASLGTRRFKGLASAIGKFYATWFFAIRGVKKLWQSIESSMEYVETLNYFNAAFEQVADKAVGAWEAAGYESAEAYYKSFAERAETLTAQMSGYTVSESGMLTPTGGKTLGVDPSQLMQYQAVFAQMSSSMGVSSENALKLSRALTEIGADIASVKNLEFEDVWNDMASGLAGMSRTLDKYGVNIRNVNLQQKLTDLGINANIDSLNQNDKALLRTIILLDSTRYAWGDLAETINQPANQLRLLQSNFSNLARTIGNIFLPIVANVIPYVNGFVIALQRLAQWIVNLLGFTGFEWGSIGSVGDDFMSGIYDDAENAADGLGDATDAAKEFKNQLLGFDEITKLTEAADTTTSAGSGAINSAILDDAFADALDEYQKHWDKAFDEMENRAQKLADEIFKAFKPLQELIEHLFNGEFYEAGQDLSNIVVAIFTMLSDAIEKVDWRKIGTAIGDFLRGINWKEVFKSLGKLIWNAINAAIDIWKGAFDAAPIETVIVTAIALLHFTGVGAAIGSKIVAQFVSYLGLTETINAVGSAIGTLLYKATLVGLAAIGGWTVGEKIAEDVFGFETYGFFGTIEEILNVSPEEAFDALALWGEDIYETWKEIGEGIIDAIKKPFEKFFGWIEGIWNKIKKKVYDFFGIEEENTEFHSSGRPGKGHQNTTAKNQALVQGAAELQEYSITLNLDTTKALAAAKNLPKEINTMLGRIQDVDIDLKTIEVLKEAETIKAEINKKIAGIRKYTPLVDKSNAETSINTLTSNINKKISSIGKFTPSVNKGNAETAINTLTANINKKIAGVNKFTPRVDTSKATQDANTLATKIKNALGGLKFKFEATSNIKDKISSIFKNGLKAIFDFGQIKAYATGGFPEDGLFFANSNELVGRFDNGRTAVANNAQITAGIEEAAYRGMVRALSQTSGSQNGASRFTILLDGKTVYDNVLERMNADLKSGGVVPFSI